MNAPSKKPIRKVSAGTIAAVITYLILYVLPDLGVEITPDIAGVIPVVVGFVVAYLIPSAPGDLPTLPAKVEKVQVLKRDVIE
jgi:putative flippase GtrA